MSGKTRPIEILLADDDPRDVRLTLHALADSKLRNTVDVVRDSAAARLNACPHRHMVKTTTPLAGLSCKEAHRGRDRISDAPHPA